jgi:hypothetical protein
MCLALVVGAFLTVGAAQQFPHLQEENLNGRQVTLPDAAAGKVAVLVLGFSHASSTPTGAWAKRAQEDFGKNPNFVLYQLAVIEEAPRFVRGMITSGIKKGIPENQRGYFVPVVHDEAELKKLVNYKEADDAYIVVLDRGGKVVYQTHGATVGAAYDELHTKVQTLLK